MSQNLEKMFVEVINKAKASADIMTDINSKPAAYASIAQALATYLCGAKTSYDENPSCDNESSEEVSNKTEEKSKEQWIVPVDENGIPYLNDEDKKDPKKVIAYNKAMTPEIKAKKEQLEKAAGEKVLNENTGTKPQNKKAKPEARKPGEKKAETPKEKTMTKEQTEKLNAYKESFGYKDDPSVLDNLLFNFTSGVMQTLDALKSGEIADAFMLFIEEQLKTAYDSLEAWKDPESLGMTALNKILADAYEDENATVDEFVFDGNIFWFLEAIELYNANAWLDYYKESLSAEELDSHLKQCFDDGSINSIDELDDTNIICFSAYLQKTLEETA